jgi:hypothetical protein
MRRQDTFCRVAEGAFTVGLTPQVRHHFGKDPGVPGHHNKNGENGVGSRSLFCRGRQACVKWIEFGAASLSRLRWRAATARRCRFRPNIQAHY